MVPGICTSESNSEISERASKIASASSALTASTARKPASSTMSTARIRRTISSSTTSTLRADPSDLRDMEKQLDKELKSKLKMTYARLCTIPLQITSYF